MIESYENALQIAVLLVCVGIALVRAIAGRSRTWTLLSFFYGSWALGDIFWTVCLIFFGETPQISLVADLSWYASYIFLYLLLRHVAPPTSPLAQRLLPWLGPVFTAGMALFFMMRGEVFSNLIYAALMGLLLFSAIHRLVDGRRNIRQGFLCVLIIAFCLLEYGLWVSSCFWTDPEPLNPYYWFDLLLTVCFPFFLAATRRAVAS